MLNPVPEGNELDAVLEQYKLPRLLRGLFLQYSRLSDVSREEFEARLDEWIRDVASQLRDTQLKPQEPPRIGGLTREEALARVNAQYDELEQEGAEKGASRSISTFGPDSSEGSKMMA